MSYAEIQKAEDGFAVGAEVYCPRDGDGRDGALTDLAFFIDPGHSADPEGGGFYRLVCDAISAPRRSVSPTSAPISADSRWSSNAGR